MTTTRRKERGNTAAVLTAANEVLLHKELCIETDTGKMKVGDGVTAWTSLPYFTAGGGGAHPDLAAHDTLGLATQAELDAAAALKIDKALVDAKGDLIVATAADVVARRAVGTNGQVLTADSGEATGVKWAAPAAGGIAHTRGVNNAGNITYAAPLPGQVWVEVPALKALYPARIYSAPFDVAAPWTPSEVLIEVTVAAAGAGLRVWFYNRDANLQPSTLVLDTGAAMSVATTGVKSITGLTTTFQPGPYVVQWISDGAPTVRVQPVASQIALPTAPGNVATSLDRDGGAAYGAAPANGSKWQDPLMAVSPGLLVPVYWR